MTESTLVGIDTAKASFSMYGLSGGKKSLERAVTRDKFIQFWANHPKAMIVMEACGGSHFWGRELKALGHEVKLLAPQKVRPFRKINKNDSNDARAIATAAACAEVKFVAVKEVWQQDIQSLHRIRSRHIHHQTSLVNEMRGLLAEYGVVIAQGINNVRALVPLFVQDEDNKLTPILRSAIADMHDELLRVTSQIEKIDKQLIEIFNSNEVCQRLGMVEGIGVITATALYASCADPSLFKNGRQFAAWLGLTPGHRQTGGKDKKAIMLGITKHGDPYLRKLLVQGAMSVSAIVKNKTFDKENAAASSEETKVSSGKKEALPPSRKRLKPSIRKQKSKSDSKMKWLKRLIDEKGIQKASVALANRNARVVFALLKSGEAYNSLKGGRLVA